MQQHNVYMSDRNKQQSVEKMNVQNTTTECLHGRNKQQSVQKMNAQNATT